MLYPIFGTIVWYTILTLRGYKKFHHPAFVYVIYIYIYIYTQPVHVPGASGIAELLTIYCLLGKRAWRTKTALKNNRIRKVTT